MRKPIQSLLDRKNDFDRIAKSSDTSAAYLIQIAHGFRLAGHKLAKRIDKATKGEVSKAALRPDIFGP